MRPLVRVKPVEMVAVVVPARDESDRLGDCLVSIERAARHERVRELPVRIVVVADACVDDSATTAGLPGLGGLGGLGGAPNCLRQVVEVDYGNVGKARGEGFRLAIEAALVDAGAGRSRGGVRSLDHLWLATTDADTRVPPDWIAVQLRWRDRGAGAVAGLVRVEEWHQRPESVRHRYRHHVGSLGVGLGHPHVHGANLAVSAVDYLRAGGMPPVETGEDHALWRALRRTGSRIVAAPDLVVTTSARRDGRAPGGFSSLLDELSVP